eukprot:3968816-Prymnesium_polylepis.1
MVLLAYLGKGFPEAAERVLVLHPCDFERFLVDRPRAEVLILTVIRPGRHVLHARSRTRRICCLARVEQVPGPMVRRHVGRHPRVPEALILTATAARPATIACDLRMPLVCVEWHVEIADVGVVDLVQCGLLSLIHISEPTRRS